MLHDYAGFNGQFFTDDLIDRMHAGDVLYDKILRRDLENEWLARRELNRQQVEEKGEEFIRHHQQNNDAVKGKQKSQETTGSSSRLANTGTYHHSDAEDRSLVRRMQRRLTAEEMITSFKDGTKSIKSDLKKVQTAYSESSGSKPKGLAKLHADQVLEDLKNFHPDRDPATAFLKSPIFLSMVKHKTDKLRAEGHGDDARRVQEAIDEFQKTHKDCFKEIKAIEAKVKAEKAGEGASGSSSSPPPKPDKSSGSPEKKPDGSSGSKPTAGGGGGKGLRKGFLNSRGLVKRVLTSADVNTKVKKLKDEAKELIGAKDSHKIFYDENPLPENPARVKVKNMVGNLVDMGIADKENRLRKERTLRNNAGREIAELDALDQTDDARRYRQALDEYIKAFEAYLTSADAVSRRRKEKALKEQGESAEAGNSQHSGDKPEQSGSKPGEGRKNKGKKSQGGKRGS